MTKKLALSIEPRGDGYYVTINQAGVPEIYRIVSGRTLLDLARSLGSQWLAPDDRDFMFHVDGSWFRITRESVFGPFAIEYAGQRQDAATVEELIARAQSLLGHPDWTLDRPATLTIEVV